jgi:hypothetical protein
MILGNSDFVWTYGVSPDFDSLLGQRCELIAKQGRGRLYRTPGRPPGI